MGFFDLFDLGGHRCQPPGYWQGFFGGDDKFWECPSCGQLWRRELRWNGETAWRPARRSFL